MDGEKETAEDKEEEEGSSHELPIMHWEDLSQRIAELEKQEQDRRERSKSPAGPRMEGDEEDDVQRCRVVSSRFYKHRNLQLCFINNSDSEEEEEEEEGADMKVPKGCHAAGLKQEVAAALRALRDELLAEQKEVKDVAETAVARQHAENRKHLEPRELQEAPVQLLTSMRASLQQEVHALSSELVAQLLVRDQLRTKQDAMLLDVQDLT